MRYNDYDALAAGYAADNDENATNAHYERPASLALCADVTAHRVLDAGCGTGAHAAALLTRGARVTGIDASAGMLAIARDRLGPSVPLHHADLADPLPFADGSFDLVLAPLVLHYLEDWQPTLREFHRVLVPGGRLVASTHHPFTDHAMSGHGDYFATYQWTEQWAKHGHTATMRFWHRPLTAMTTAFPAAGFTVDTITEPMPVPEAATRHPETYANLRTNPRFLFFTAHRP